MTDCTRIAPLLEVYADNEASAETNAMVLDHLPRCDRCARALGGIVSLRGGLRETLGAGSAPADLRARILSGLEVESAGRLRRLAGAWRRWLVPAAATLAAAAVWIASGDPVDARQVESAVAEHVMCALEKRGPLLADTVAAERGLATAMPWIRGEPGGPHVVEAHTCGAARPFAHVVLDLDGSTASILIAPRAPAGDAASPVSLVRGDFEVSVLTTARHVAYVIADRRSPNGARALRGPTLMRVERFLQQMEGRS
jgi:hypothetical protein